MMRKSVYGNILSFKLNFKINEKLNKQTKNWSQNNRANAEADEDRWVISAFRKIFIHSVLIDYANPVSALMQQS